MFLLRKTVSSSSFNCPIFLPFTKTLPEVGMSNPPIIFNNVDFPLPEAPTIATNSPSSISNETLFKTG